MNSSFDQHKTFEVAQMCSMKCAEICSGNAGVKSQFERGMNAQLSQVFTVLREWSRWTCPSSTLASSKVVGNSDNQQLSTETAQRSA